jgi:hypothetical protein
MELPADVRWSALVAAGAEPLANAMLITSAAHSVAHGV